MQKLIVVALFFVSINLYAQNSYFFPTGNFDPTIPSPEQFLGYPVGDWHTRHENIVSYFKELARVSPKAHFQLTGYTNEHRSQVVLTITRAENCTHIEVIRTAHLKLKDPSASVDIYRMQVQILQGNNGTGN